MKNSIFCSKKAPAFLAFMTLTLGAASCGPKDTVVEEDSASRETGADTRSRLTGGTPLGNNMNYCRYPLDLSTQLDPRRPGLSQAMLTSSVDSRCAQSRDARITLRTRQKLSLVGRYSCRAGVQSNEQICVIPTSEILSTQRTSLSIPVVADETLRQGDVEATVELY